MPQVVHHHTLANGLTLLAERMEDVRSAALNVLVPAGCVYDPPRHPGLASRARPPTRQELLAAVDHLARRMAADREAGRKAVLYFVYAGHGQKNAVGEVGTA